MWKYFTLLITSFQLQETFSPPTFDFLILEKD